VAAEAADTLILLQPASSSRAAAEALQVTTLISLLALRQRAGQQHSGTPGHCTRAVAVLWAALGRGSSSSSTSSSSVRIIVQEAAVPSGSARAEQGAVRFVQAAAASSGQGEAIQTCGLLSPTMLQT
jgi:hypothetical protein